MKNRGHSQRKAHALIAALREKRLGGDGEQERFTCRRCNGSLVGVEWQTIGNDSATGRPVKLCESCLRELSTDPAPARLWV